MIRHSSALTVINDLRILTSVKKRILSARLSRMLDNTVQALMRVLGNLVLELTVIIRKSIPLELIDVLKQRLFVALRAHLLINPTYHAGRIDHEGGSVPIHRPFVLALSDATGFQQLGAGVGEKVDCEPELSAK